MQMEDSYFSWLEDLWRPFDGPQNLSTPNTLASTSSIIHTNRMASTSSSSMSSSTAPPTMPIRSKDSADKKARNPYPIPCKCPDGGGQKPARHWRTKCPYNTRRDVANLPSCDLCGRPFNRLDNLKRHRRDVHRDA